MKIYVDECLEVNEETVAVLEAAGHEVVSKQDCDLALLVMPKPDEVARLYEEGHRVVALESLRFGRVPRQRDWFRANVTDVVDRPDTAGTQLGYDLIGIIETALTSKVGDPILTQPE